MDKSILITILVSDATLEAAYQLAEAVGPDEARRSILLVAPFSQDSINDLTTQLFELSRSLGFMDEGMKGKVKLIAGMVGSHGVKSEVPSGNT